MSPHADRVVDTSLPSEFFHLVDSSTSTTNIANPTISTTAPTTQALKVQGSVKAKFIFGGTDAANEASQAAGYQVIAWYRVRVGTSTLYVPVVILRGQITLGATAGAVATDLFADTVTDTISENGTVVSSGKPADSVAYIEVLLRNADYITAATDINTAATLDIWVQVS